MEDRPTLQAAAWGVAAIVVVLVCLRLLGSDPAPPPATVASGAPDAVGASRPRERGPYVHVAGAVRRPGLYRLASGARVAAAVRRAGGAGPDADLTAINLAARLEDGQQVVVPARGPVGQGVAGSGQVSLGTATAEELDELDGIGPTLAERIVEHRGERGGLSSVEDLADVEGIGEKRLEALRESLVP